MTEASAPIPATANFINPDAMHRPTGYTRAEGLGELGMGAAAAVGGSGAGLLLAGGGFWLVSVVAVAPCLLLLAAVAAGGRRRAAAAPAGPALDPPRNRGGREGQLEPIVRSELPLREHAADGADRPSTSV